MIQYPIDDRVEESGVFVESLFFSRVSFMSFKIRQYPPAASAAPTNSNPCEPPIVIDVSAAKSSGSEPTSQENLLDKAIQSPFLTGLFVGLFTDSAAKGALTTFALDVNQKMQKRK